MTITQAASAPLFAVVGSTGVQGGSVVRALLASPKAYRVRAITRNPSKPSAQAISSLGCEVVSANVGDLESVKVAFSGADYAFAMTDHEFVWVPESKSDPAFDHKNTVRGYPIVIPAVQNCDSLAILPRRNLCTERTKSMPRKLLASRLYSGRDFPISTKCLMGNSLASCASFYH